MIRRWRRPNLSPVRVYSIDLNGEEPRFELMARASLGRRGELRWAFAKPGAEDFLSEFRFRAPDDVRRQFSVSSLITTDWPPVDPRRLRPLKRPRPPAASGA